MTTKLPHLHLVETNSNSNSNSNIYADLYAANQASTELINEARTEETPLRFMDQDVFHHQPLSLD